MYLYASIYKQIKQPITAEITINSRIQKQALYRGAVHILKNLPAVQETQVQSLGWEDSPGEGNGCTPQHSWLGDPMDRGAWRITVHSVAKS